MFKRILMAAAVVVLGMGMAQAVSPDAFEISVTPSLNYSVAIATPASGIEFTGIDVGTTYVSADTATVTNDGNVSADWKITGTALDDWTLGAAPAANVARVLAILNSEAAGSGDFDTSNDDIGPEANMDATNFTGDQTGNDVAASAQRLMSIRLDSPTDTSYDSTQRFRVEVTAYPSSEF